jgi:quercetin dioxygenase-like cupin family protein
MAKPISSLTEIPSDVKLRPEGGWVNMDVRWLATEETFGARHHVMGRTLFMPGGGHMSHKHPYAEEVLYILRGRLITTIGDETFCMGPHDVCYVPPDTLHVMRNVSPTEPCEIIFVYGGAPSLAKAGYVGLPDPPQRDPLPRGASRWVRTLPTIPSDVKLRPEGGWVNMDVKWLVDDTRLGSRTCVLGRTIFPPGSSHGAHSHPRAEEAMYVVRGYGETLDGETWHPMGPEDVVFTPAGVRHGFRNTSPSEPCETIWTYGGAASLGAAGYVEMR